MKRNCLALQFPLIYLDNSVIEFLQLDQSLDFFGKVTFCPHLQSFL